MTHHGIIFTIVAISTTSIGVLFRWQEFLLIGLLFLFLLIASATYVAYSPASLLANRQQLLSTTRTIEISFMIEVESIENEDCLLSFQVDHCPIALFLCHNSVENEPCEWKLTPNHGATWNWGKSS